ncbi:SURF1 family protein [Aestuariirhabdus sp. LZHN29]|uniref:SURF1 family protein n=1 Tax=Aestuariirhabdus sp. LZHN29 TaxID=3417462 RepID=UPI003CF4E739
MTISRYQFTFSWWLSVIFLLFLMLFSGLAIWQWDRAQQKLALQQRIERMQAMPPQTPIRLDGVEGEAHLPLAFKGHYLADSTFLLDNIVSNGKPGFYVMTAFGLDDQGTVILVNRGWVPALRHRETLPEIDTPQSPLALTGALMPPRSKPLVGGDLARPDLYVGGLWQYLDLSYLERQLGRPVFPWVLNLDPESISGYQRQWSSFDAKVGMHYGYFLYWLVFALFSVAAYLSLTIKKRSDD